MRLNFCRHIGNAGKCCHRVLFWILADLMTPIQLQNINTGMTTMFTSSRFQRVNSGAMKRLLISLDKTLKLILAVSALLMTFNSPLDPHAAIPPCSCNITLLFRYLLIYLRHRQIKPWQLSLETRSHFGSLQMIFNRFSKTFI